MTTLSPGLIWLLLGIIGVGTWLIRFSFLGLLSRVEEIPPVVLRGLQLIPAAALAALVAPGLTHAEGSFDLGTTRFIAGLVALLAAWRTQNVLATIGVGMGVLWVLEWIV